MVCPRCGHEMKMDGHRKIDLLMCYECGYIEGRNTGDCTEADYVSNYEHLRSLNFNEAVAFVSEGLGIKEEMLAGWLEREYIVPTVF